MANATEAPLPGSAPSPRKGFRDSLGDRLIVNGPGENELLEILHLRRELTAVSSFEFALRERTARLANFQHNAYARVRQIDRLPPPDGRLAIVSEHVPGGRLAEIVSAVQERHLELDINAALSLIKQLVHAVAILHQHARGVAHGALGPERIVITAHARLVIVEYVLGSALERLDMPRERLWRELRIAIPPAAGGGRFDARADVTQVGTIAMALVLGCPLAADDYPDHMADLLALATENRTLGGRRPLSKPLRAWLGRALQLDLHRSFPSAIEAQSELEALLIAEPSYVAAPVALETFLAAYQRSVAGPTEEAAGGQPEAAAEEAYSVEREVKMPPTPSRPRQDAGMELDNVISDLDRLLDEPPPGRRPAAAVERPGPAPAVAQIRPGFDAAARADRSAPVTPPGDRTFPARDRVPPSEVPPAAQATDRTPAARTPEPASRPAFAAPAKPASEVAPRAPATPARPIVEPASAPGRDRGTSHGYESLFGSSLSAAREPRKEDYEHAAEVGEESSRKRTAPILIALAAVLVLAVGGYFAYRTLGASGQQAATGTLTVESQPPGLAVKNDGTARGTTPVKVALPPGQHQMEIDTGTGPRVMAVTITAGGQVSQYIEAQAAPATGKLQVTSEPPGAVVLVDGERRGTAPILVADLAVGRHRVELQADGSTVQQEVTIEPGGTNSLVVPMSSPRSGPVSGWLAVSSPVELQVYEGSQLLGSTQTERILMTVGRHDLDVVNDTLGFRSRHIVQVPPGRVVSVRVQLPKGSLSVNAIPWADVLVDGQPAGQTPIGNLSLTIGPHEVLFRHPQLGEQRHAVTVTMKAPARLSVDLRK